MTLTGGYNAFAREFPLHPYQEAAHDFLVDRLYVKGQIGAGLFLDPGLGKTRITASVIDTLFNLGELNRVLVIAPLRPVYTVWPNEYREWGFPQSHVILHSQHQLGLALGRQIELMNYDSLKKIAELQNRWDLLVLDESTYIKNWSTKRMGYIKQLIKTIPKRIILTGTPAANSLTDLFSQLYVVDDGASLGRSVTRFRGAFCYQGGYYGRKWFVNDAAEYAIEKAIGDRVLYMKCEDYLDMPKLVKNDVWVDLPPGPRRQYNKLKHELYAELETGNVFAANASSAYSKCRQFSSGQVFATDEDGKRIPDSASEANFEYHVAHKEKINALVELKTELAGKPLLVFYWFKHEIAELLKNKDFWASPDDLPTEKRKLYNRLKKSGNKLTAESLLRPPVIRAKMKIQEVDRIINEWNEDVHKVIFCQWAATSYGLNMQKGSCADIATITLTESAGGFDQGFRRVYRQGQKAKQVRLHRFVARGTVDEVNLRRVDGKLKTQDEFFAALKKHAKVAV